MNLARAKFLTLVPEAFTLCCKYRLLLWTRPVPTLKRPGRSPAPTQSPTPPSEISRAVHCAARFIPSATCLPQALTAQEMLLRRGIPCRLEIGVTLENGFAAHAWVVSNGSIVHGDNGQSYAPLRPAVRRENP